MHLNIAAKTFYLMGDMVGYCLFDIAGFPCDFLLTSALPYPLSRVDLFDCNVQKPFTVFRWRIQPDYNHKSVFIRKKKFIFNKCTHITSI